jgi:hypothetical protein
MLLSVGVYLYGSNSEPYRFAEQWVRDAAEIRDRVGDVKRTRLSVSGVFSDETKGEVREARVSTIVNGSTGSVVATLWLEKRGDRDWVVVRCQLHSS